MKFLTNRNILTEELQNAIILKDLVMGNKDLDKTYAEVVSLLANKVLASLKEEPTIEVKVSEPLMNNLRKELKRELTRKQHI